MFYVEFLGQKCCDIPKLHTTVISSWFLYKQTLNKSQIRNLLFKSFQEG